MVPQTASLIFSINTDGSGWQPLIVFGVPANSNPWGSLTLDGNEFFLMTRYGGDMSNWNGHGYGAIYGFNDLGLGIDELSTGSSINVFPNPTNGNITFQFSKPLQGIIEIYDIAGKAVLNEKFAQSPIIIDCAKFINGTYFYKVSDANGNLIKSDKIVVIH
jgi:hypothetical protein